MAASLVFYMFFLLFSALAAAPRSSNITLGSLISPRANPVPTAWFSPSGRFAFGFYPEGSGFHVGVWLQSSPGDKTVIWTANPNDAPLPEDAMVKFTRQGLELHCSDADQDSYFPVPGLGGAAASASMLDTGNFVIYDSDSGVLWDLEGSGHPTDTIISGQVLTPEYELVSCVSPTIHSSGRFRLKMDIDGNLLMYPKLKTTAEDAYWTFNTTKAAGKPYRSPSSDGKPSPDTDGNLDKSLNLGSDATLYLLWYNHRQNLTTSRTTAGSFCRATLDVDGIFRLYSHDLVSNSSKVLAEFPQLTDSCEIKDACGINSFCTMKDGQQACSCIPRFDFVDASSPWSGCNSTFTGDACQNDDVAFIMEKLENVVWLDDPYDGPWSVGGMEACSEACRLDCNCGAALFKEGMCSKQNIPLRYGRRVQNDSTMTLVKVGIPNPNGNSLGRNHEDKSHVMKLGASVATNIGLFFVILVLCFFFCKNRGRRSYGRMSTRKRELDLVEEIAPRSFCFQELRDAANNFKELPGKGAFGTVFKGVLLRSGRAIAIKRLEKVIDEGERVFRAEMSAMGRTHHKNLVRLLGFCYEGPHRLLVYEYMSNGSLADLIFDADRCPDWCDRARITLDIAKGIHYLHEECEASIIHCDIKPQNILMDEAWTAKISDFGLAKLLMPSQSRTFTEIRGTRGYLAPEWHKNAPITVKADVYSFGIVLLEIVCRRRNMELEAEVDEIVLLDWVYSCFMAGELEKIVPEDEVDLAELNRFVKVGLWCTLPEPASRPSMKNVVMMLEGHIGISLPPILPFGF